MDPNADPLNMLRAQLLMQQRNGLFTQPQAQPHGIFGGIPTPNQNQGIHPLFSNMPRQQSAIAGLFAPQHQQMGLMPGRNGG